MSTLRQRVPALAAVCGLALLTLGLYWNAVFQGQVFFKRDIHLIWLPQVEALLRAVAAGSWPIWDPLASFGQPLLADPSAQILYPPTWLSLLMRPWRYYTLFVVLHTWLSGVGMFLLGRRWGASPFAAFVGAGLWCAGGSLQSYVDLWHHFAGACWIPLVFLAAESALARPGVAGALRLGAALSGQILAGSADMCAMTGLALAAHVAVNHLEWRRGRRLENRRALATLAGAALLALGLSAALWLPALDVVSRSARRALPSEIRTFWSLSPVSLLDLVFPGVWTPLLVRPALPFLREVREPFLDTLYLGLPSLALVGAALVGGWGRRAAFLATTAAAALLVALGRHTPFYDLLVAVLPPLQVLRYPVKAMILVGFAWALLAALGLDTLRRPDLPPLRRWRLAVLLPLAALTAAAAIGAWLTQGGLAPTLLPPRGFGLLPYSQLLPATALRLGVSASLAGASLALLAARGRGARWPPYALALLALGDLTFYHRHLMLAPEALVSHRPALATALATADDPRVYCYDYDRPAEYVRRFGRPYRRARPLAGWSREAAHALGQQLALAYQTAGRWGLRTAYEPDFRGLHASSLAELTSLLARVEGTGAWVKLLRMGAVTRVVALHEQGLEALEPIASFPGLFPEPVRLYGVPDPLPRAYVVANTSIARGSKALARFLEPDWDPRQELILSEGAARRGPASFAGSARIVEERADRIVLEAELSDAGYLVLVDSYDPGWRASVDGQAATLLSANLAFRAVPLAPGRRRVELLYRPKPLLAGAVFSLASLAAGLTVAGAARFRRSRAGTRVR